MDDTPEDESTRAFERPFIPSQLICKPAATTRFSYSMLLPEVVVIEEAFGENDLTLSEICVRCLGTRDASGRRKSLFGFNPAPTSVLR